MSNGKIVVTTAQLESVAKTIDTKADSYKDAYTKIFTIVTELSASWTGVDNTAFTNQIEGFKNDFQKMEQLMRDYSTVLQKSAASYEETQTAIKTNVTKLNQGN